MTAFREYLEYGWKLCDIPPGHKGPQGEGSVGWHKQDRAISDPAAARSLMGAGLLHAWSGTCALDVDNYEVAQKWLAERGVDLQELLTARTAVKISSGRQGRYKLLYLLDEPLRSKKLAPYKAMSQKSGKEETYHGFELRCANANGDSVQDVLPPTIHPDTGRPYEWVYGDDLLGDWRALPRIPSVLLALWQDAIGDAAAPLGPVAPAGVPDTELGKLLAQQDPSDYDTWIKWGAAIHHETQGSREGFRIWHLWSQGSSKYAGEADCAARWRSFHSDAPNAVTVASLKRAAVAQLDAFPVAEPAPQSAADAPGVVPQVGDASASENEGWEIVRKTLEPRLVFVRGQDHYFDMATYGEPWLSDRSLRHLFCPVMPTITIEPRDGKPSKPVKPDPVNFMQNSRSKIVVDAAGIHPGAPRLYSEDGRKFVNRYFPKKIEPLKPLPFEEEAFLFLWSRIEDRLVQRWLMRFYAHALQKPGVKIQAAPLLVSSETGTGKNTICHVIPQLLFGHQWVRTISGDVLKGQFNDTVGETWWLYLEELRAGTTKADRVALTNKIKAWVTDGVIEVHPKGLKPYNMRNRIQITATSNFEDALQLDNNDRRWVISDMREPLTEREATDVYHFLHSERAPGVLHHIFRNVDLTGFSPTARAPTTVAKVAMVRAGIGAWESTMVEYMVQGRPPFDKDLFRVQEAFEWLQTRGGPQSAAALRNVLTKPPFSCKQLPHCRSQRLYAWRNYDLWAEVGDGARTRYLETGARPLDVKWDLEIPEAILAMSADGPQTPEKPLCDLV